MTYPSLPETAAWLLAAREAVEARGPLGRPGQRRRHADGRAHARARRGRRASRGTYIYGDRACIANGSVPLEDCALRVVATVVSRPTRERAIIDAGSKTLTSDLAIGATGHGLLVEFPEAEVYALNEEHGYVDVSRCEPPPEIGDRVTIVPNHACTTANMHDEIVHAPRRRGRPDAAHCGAWKGEVRDEGSDSAGGRCASCGALFPVVVSGDLVYTAGQVGFDESGQLTADDITGQTQKVFENLLACLAAAGCGPLT